MASPPTSEVGRQHPLTSDRDSFQTSAGKCYFRDLASGKDAPICGCRCFYADDARGLQNDPARDGRSVASSAAWCFCGHHVCFHERGRRERIHQRTAVPKPMSCPNGRVNLAQSPQLMPKAIQLVRGFDRHGTPIDLRRHGMTLQGSPHLQELSILAPNIDARGMHHRINHDTCSGTRPHHRSHFPHHTTQPVHDLHDHPQSVGQPGPEGALSGGIILDHVSTLHNDTCHLTAARGSMPMSGDILRSVTELATTPSIPGTPLAGSFQLQNGPIMDTTDSGRAIGGQSFLTNHDWRVISTPQPTPASRSPLRPPTRHVPPLSASDTRASLAELSSRLDALESASFSHTCVDDLQDRFEAIDGHIFELHARYEDLERQRAMESSEDASEAIRLGSYHVGEKIDCLEQRVQQLEHTSSPSRTKPWKLEVVFLPWGRELSNIWVPSADVDSKAAVSALPTSTQDWRQDSTDWLFPRACGPTGGLSGSVYTRLHSRGLIQCVTVMSNGARELQEQLEVAFAGFAPHLKSSQGGRHTVSSKGPVSESTSYLGLEAQFIPLRKIHKSSRLRFLSTAELATPTLWTCDFLDASVFMKIPSIGLRRLFVTEPSAYLQPSGNASGYLDWSWQRLRELPRVHFRKVDSLPETVDEADAREDCWKWNSRLDPPSSVATSFVSPDANSHGWRPASSPEVLVYKSAFFVDDDPPAVFDDIATRQVPVTPTSGTSAKRSLGQHMQADYSRKRRRFSSPNLGTAGPPTPRRSYEPPSPGTIGMFLASRSSQALTLHRGELDAGVCGAGAALAYATPHSNTIKRREEQEQDSGTDQDDWEADVESSALHHGCKVDDEVWEGVGENDMMPDVCTGGNALKRHSAGMQELNRIYDTVQDEEDDDGHDEYEDEDDDDDIDSDIDDLVHR